MYNLLKYILLSCIIKKSKLKKNPPQAECLSPHPRKTPLPSPALELTVVSNTWIKADLLEVESLLGDIISFC